MSATNADIVHIARDLVAAYDAWHEENRRLAWPRLDVLVRMDCLVAEKRRLLAEYLAGDAKVIEAERYAEDPSPPPVGGDGVERLVTPSGWYERQATPWRRVFSGSAWGERDDNATFVLPDLRERDERACTCGPAFGADNAEPREPAFDCPVHGDTTPGL